MDRDQNEKDGKNLWERSGRRGGLLESENVRRHSTVERSGGRGKQAESSHSGSRYAQSRGRQAENSHSGSRYARNEDWGRQTENSHSGSRYVRNEDLGRQAESSHSGSRYVRNEDLGRQAENSHSGSRYVRNEDLGRQAESVHSGSRYVREDSSSGGSKEAAAASFRHSPSDKRGKQKIDPVKAAFLALGAVMVIAYVVVAFYFGGHFYSGSQIYGIDCSKKTADQVKGEVKEKIGEYALTVELRDGKQDTITADQINLQYRDESGIERQLKKQHCYVWPAMMLMGKSNDLVIGTVYDRDNMDSVLRQLNCFLPGNVVAPQDAHRGDTDYGYEVVPEVMGTTLDFEKTKAVIMDALDKGLSSVSLDEAGCYIDPAIYQDDEALNAQVEELNALLKAHITYDFDDRREVVDANVMKNWICQEEDGTYYIDDNQIWAYVEELAGKYDTFGGERVFYTSIGTAVTLSGGDYGWVIDQNATAEILRDAVKEGKTETLEPIYVYTAMDRKENDIGGTYVEVCISMQEMWCYENGYLVVDTPVVTGNPNKGNATPSGSVWAIDAKMRDYVLRGEGYAAPVDYWMPFDGDIGIHDMQNRYYFGGSIYLSNGSHGCVNTPYEAAQTIYNTVSIGTPVVVYE